MISETVLVAASYERPADAEAAVKELGGAGFDEQEISLLYTDKGHLAKEGLVEGAAFGGMLGGLVGLLFPPAGIIVAAGPVLGTLASALAGAGATAVAGGALYALTNTLIQVGMPKEMAGRFGENVHKGDTLVIVHASAERADQARSVLDTHGPRTSDDSRSAAETGAAPAQAPR
jgi:hypothetical protein